MNLNFLFKWPSVALKPGFSTFLKNLTYFPNMICHIYCIHGKSVGSSNKKYIERSLVKDEKNIFFYKTFKVLQALRS